MATPRMVGASADQPTGSNAVSFNASLLVMMAIFWVMYLILRVFLFKPIMALLDDRRSRIETAQAALDGATAIGAWIDPNTSPW